MNTRRQFLRSSTALIALPFLESLGFKAFTASQPVAQRKRMIFLGFGWGVTKETWYPDRATTGAEWSLPPGLQPLARHQKDITVIQNLANKFTNEAHWGSTFWLTGANRYGEPGQSFHNSVSADQIAAEAFGKDTRFTSLQLSCENGEESGHGPGLSLAWDRQGKPVSGFNSPVVAFHRLFSNETTTLEQRQAQLRQKRSVLDTVLDDAESVARGLGREDTDKLAEYLQSVRDIEVRIAKDEQWLDKPKPTPGDDVREPKGEVTGAEEIRLMYALIAAALQADLTRVATYRQPVNSLLKGLKIPFSGHNMSHYSPGARMEASQLRDSTQAELLAGFIDKLKATKEPDGTTLFDHTTLAYGSNIQSIHYLDNCPTLVTGGGAGVRLGQHVVMRDPKTPLCNLWLTLLRGNGLDVTSHGDSTGIIHELIA